jgi:hypothetical protein
MGEWASGRNGETANGRVSLDRSTVTDYGTYWDRLGGCKASERVEPRNPSFLRAGVEIFREPASAKPAARQALAPPIQDEKDCQRRTVNSEP